MDEGDGRCGDAAEETERVMPREQTPLRPICVDYRCDACQRGHYRPTGCVASNPIQYPHACDKCGNQRTFFECYPVLRFTFDGGLLNLNEYQECETPLAALDRKAPPPEIPAFLRKQAK